MVLCALAALVPSEGVAKKKDTTVCVEVILQSPKSAVKSPPATPASQPASAPTVAPGDGGRIRRPWHTANTDDDDEHGEDDLVNRPKKASVKKPAWSEQRVDHSLLPLGQTPEAYLKRLFEHFVTHQEGFVAVESGCRERMRVELFPLREGWTAFTRYSGHGREERVDRLYADELSQFAERAVLALLGNRPISSTIMRDTVLRADSKPAAQRIQGTHHFLVALGTQIRGGKVPTAGSGGDAPASIRVFSPMSLSTGYRARFESWGLATMAHLALGTSKTSIRENSLGGHIDLGGGFGANLHFLLYSNPRGITSFYFGGGSTFEVLWLSVVRPEGKRGDDNRSTLFSGGLTVDAVCGWEFMRASSVQFLLQGELNLPAYLAYSENDDGSLKSWLPGLTVKLGVMF
jgi:hypothetical protein